MNKILKKVVSISVLASMVCYTTPIFAFTKDETVYSKLDASGKNYKTIVSTHIDNREGLQTINDLTNLLNIENTNGDETFSQDGKSLIWDAKGNDIYYKGESKENLPISIEIKYELDGEEIEPEKVAGKTGEVTITIIYKNNDEHRVYVNGSYQTMYTPFVVAGGTIISNNNNNIQSVTNAKVINDGTKSIVVGIFFPGLQESLGLSKNTLEIPKEMKITVDAKDFEMGQIINFATPKLMDKENTNLVNEVKDIMNKINLVKDSTTALKDGAEELKNGTEEYNKNAKLLNAGIQQLSEGVDYMNSQYSLINEGINQINSGATELQAGAGQLQAGIPQIKAGLQQISNSIGGISLDTSIGALTQVDTGLQAIIGNLKKSTTTNNTEKIQILTAEVTKNTNQINALQERITVLRNEEASDDVLSQIELNTNMIVLLTENNAILNSTIESLKSTDATAIDTLVANLTKIDETINAVKNGTNDLKTGLTSIKGGLDTIIEKIDDVNNGINGIYNGLTGVVNGINKADGLKNGSNAMKAGLNTLNASTTELASKNTLLTEASGQIAEGAERLSDGMTEFNTAISKVLNSGLSQVASRAQGLIQLSEEYKTFTETNEEINGRVKFIIMTDKLKKEE